MANLYRIAWMPDLINLRRIRVLEFEERSANEIINMNIMRSMTSGEPILFRELNLNNNNAKNTSNITLKETDTKTRDFDR